MNPRTRKLREGFAVLPTQLLHTQWPWCVFPLCPLTNPGAFVKPCVSLSPSLWRFCVLCLLSTVSELVEEALRRRGIETRDAQGFLFSLDSDGCWQRVGGASAVGGRSWQG